MKNEDRILESLAETLQRMEQHSERFDKWQEEMKRLREDMRVQQEAMKFQQEAMRLQLDINTALMTKMQQHDDRLDRHRSNERAYFIDAGERVRATKSVSGND